MSSGSIDPVRIDVGSGSEDVNTSSPVRVRGAAIGIVSGTNSNGSRHASGGEAASRY